MATVTEASGEARRLGRTGIERRPRQRSPRALRSRAAEGA